LLTNCNFKGIYLDWVRGDFVETGLPLGDISVNKSVIYCDYKFVKRSVFYRTGSAENPSY
jgi:hypothetical protein